MVWLNIQKMKLFIKISAINVPKSNFGHIYWKNPDWETLCTYY